MVKAIWKFEIEIADRQTIETPYGSKILSVKNQRGSICLWAICDTSIDVKEKRRIAIFGTGNPLPKNLRSFNFINTVVQDGFVWHIFEETNWE